MSAIGNFYKYEKGDVIKNYEGGNREINASARIVHHYLFQRKNSVSRYGKKDANLLTKFFQELKLMSQNQNDKDLGQILKKDLMLEDFQNGIERLGLDFTKGGRGQGGIDFEREIQKLVTEKSNFGQETAYARFDLGTTDIGKAKAVAAEILGMDLEKHAEELEKMLIPGSQFNSSDPQDYYLKIGVKRYGKGDFKAGKNANMTFTVEGEPKGKLSQVKSLLLNATFSIKSYKTDRDIHLGNTDKKKAVSAVTSYVANQPGYQNAKWAGIFFIRYPEEITDTKYDSEKIKELYTHYKHMRSVYELTGLGLKYDDLQDLTSVDFLLVNRAGRTDMDSIHVYSTQELIKNFANSDKYEFSLNLGD